MSHRKLTVCSRVLIVIILTLMVLTPDYVPKVSALTGSLTEWALPDSNSGPWGIAVDQSNKVWFTENQTNRLARLDSVSNQLKEWAIPGGGNPKYVFIKPSGIGVSVYFSEYSSGKVGRFDNATNTFYEWQLHDGSDARPAGIYVDQDDHIWVAESAKDKIAEIIPISNTENDYQLPTNGAFVGQPASSSSSVTPEPCGDHTSKLCPWGIYVQTVSTIGTPNKFVWFTQSNNNAIGRLEINSHVLTTFRFSSTTDYGPLDITLDSSGSVIFTGSSFAANRISMIRNQSDTFADFFIPSSQSKATSVKWDPVHNLAWFTENNAGKVTSLDTSSGVFAIVPTLIVCTIAGSPAGINAPNCNNFAGGNSGADFFGSLGASLSSSQGFANTRAVTAVPSTLSSQDFGVFSEYVLSPTIAGPNSVAVDGNGGIWFTEQQSSGNRIGYMTITVPFNFGLSANVNSASVSQGQSASFTLSVNLISGTAQTVALSITPTVTGVTASFDPQSETPPFTSTLTLGTTSETPGGSYAFTISASGGSVTKTVPISLNVTAQTITTTPVSFDFELLVSGDTTASVVAGQTASFNLNINLLGTASSQTVQLSTSGAPAEVTATLNPTSGLPPFTSTLTLSSTVNAASGDRPITVTGTGGGQTHSTTVTLTIESPVKDFDLAVSSASFNLPQASSGSATITIQSVGIFNDPVNLAASNLPSGVSVSFTPNPVTPPTAGTATSTVTVSVPRSVSTGTYTFSITGTSGSLTHKKDITLKVSGCLVATATYGSELSPEVQFLRDFRDYQILKTFAGSNFMIAFNAWYYSFSPTVANYIATHETVKTTMKYILYPLIGVLHVSSASYGMLSIEPEIAALMAGIVASSLIGLVYLALPVSGVLWLARRRLTRSTEKRIAKSLASLVLVLLAAFVISEALVIPLAMILVSAALVLTILTIGTLLPALAIVELARR